MATNPDMATAAELPVTAASGGANSGAGGVVARPELLRRLGGSARVTVVSASAGSGKTVLLRSWISQTGRAGQTAWVTAGRDTQRPQAFWLAVSEALRGTGAGSGLVRAAPAAPDLDGWMLVKRLLTDLAGLKDELWLVIDDAHELGSSQVRRQLELLVMRTPRRLRFVFATRSDLRLGLHRLRLEGELAEIRPADLRFTLAEAGRLLSAAGVNLPSETVVVLHERTEGWAVGLRLAALLLAGHPAPEWFVRNFSGTERTVAEYLLAEVLDQYPEKVRRLLLRSSILERINGELADLLTGDMGSRRELQDLEAANAFVVSLGPERTWFRYHQLFGELLRSELDRADPAAVTGLHETAAEWLAGHGRQVEAIRHYQKARDWERAARLLADHWPSLHLDGQAATVRDLLDAFPAGMAAVNAEHAAVSAADELAYGSLDGAERFLDHARCRSETVPEPRRGRLRMLLELVGLLIARQRGDLAAVTGRMRRLEESGAAQPYPGEELRALILISLGDTEFWAGTIEDATYHSERGAALARQARRPYLEFTGAAYQALTAVNRCHSEANDRAREAIELARRHGWTTDPVAGAAYGTLGIIQTARGRFEEAEPWLQRAERVLSAETQPTWFTAFRYMSGVLEQARGRDAEALAVFESAEPLLRRLAAPHYLVPWMHASRVQVMVRLGQTGRAERFLARLPRQERDHGELRIATAGLRLAQGDPHAADAELAPVADGTAAVTSCFWPLIGWLTEAAIRDALGDAAAARAAIERSLDLAEPEGMVVQFLLFPVPKLLGRHARGRTAHAALVATIRDLPAVPPPDALPSRRMPPCEPLSGSELRVLRYLPTNLTKPEIALRLSVSPNTVKTHIRRLYAKLGVRSRAEAVESARALGLLAPSRIDTERNYLSSNSYHPDRVTPDHPIGRQGMGMDSGAYCALA